MILIFSLDLGLCPLSFPHYHWGSFLILGVHQRMTGYRKHLQHVYVNVLWFSDFWFCSWHPGYLTPQCPQTANMRDVGSFVDAGALCWDPAFRYPCKHLSGGFMHMTPSRSKTQEFLSPLSKDLPPPQATRVLFCTFYFFKPLPPPSSQWIWS